MFQLDSYTIKARLLPSFIVVLPLVLVCISYFPELVQGWKLLASVLVSFGLTMLLSQLSRDAGKKKEPKLIALWGDLPTTLAFSHQNSWLDKNTKHRQLQKLEVLTGIKNPTRDEEMRNYEDCRSVYDSYSRYLREQTRDKNKHPLVHVENVNYGFRRNLWALKTYGVATSLLGIASLFIPVLVTDLPTPTILIWCSSIISLFLLTVWLVAINPNWVKTIAFAYAERLLGSVDSST